MTRCRLLFVVLLVAGSHETAHAQFASGGVAPPSVTVGGYLRSLMGGRDAGYDTFIGDRFSMFNGDVARVKWLVSFGKSLRVDVHNRVQAAWSSSSLSATGGVLGFGVSAVPMRTLDLEQILVDADHVRVWHDIDRLAVTGYFDVADVTVGRQAITWGVSNIFPVADLWSQFSPFELDTEEKPGIDAARMLMYPAAGIEVDVVVGDRGSLRDLSAGARVTAELSVGDVYAAIGKFWRQMMALAGTSFVLHSWKIRGEVAIPWDIDTEHVEPIRTTLGADWIGSSVQLSAEYHFNGLGASSNEGYAQRLVSPELARGETYYLGRHYVGLAASHQATDRVTLAMSVLTNVRDPSIAWTPAFNYNMGQNLRLSAGGLVSFGGVPVADTLNTIILRSEFGSYGRFGYVQFSFYF